MYTVFETYKINTAHCEGELLMKKLLTAIGSAADLSTGQCVSSPCTLNSGAALS